MTEAVRYQQTECLKFILSIYDNNTFDCARALTEATFNNDSDMLKLLLPYCNSNECGGEALRQAVYNDNMKIFNMLLSVSDPTYNDSAALTAAVQQNRPDFFEILLPLSDVTGDEYLAFREALHLGYLDFAKKMYPMIDVEAVKDIVDEQDCREYGLTPDKFVQTLFEIEAHVQKETLHNSISQHRASQHHAHDGSPLKRSEVKRKM